jgi:hypothetical protein
MQQALVQKEDCDSGQIDGINLIVSISQITKHISPEAILSIICKGKRYHRKVVAARVVLCAKIYTILQANIETLSGLKSMTA